MPSTTSTVVSAPRPSSIVITPSLPTLRKASARTLPIVGSLLPAIVAICSSQLRHARQQRLTSIFIEDHLLCHDRILLIAVTKTEGQRPCSWDSCQLFCQAREEEVAAACMDG